MFLLKNSGDIDDQLDPSALWSRLAVDSLFCQSPIMQFYFKENEKQTYSRLHSILSQCSVLFVATVIPIQMLTGYCAF